MRHGSSNDIVPFVKHCVFHYNQVEVLGNQNLSILLEPRAVLDKECDWQTDDDNTKLELNNWCCTPDQRLGRKKNVWGDLWVNESNQTLKVFLVNESQYNNAGEYGVSIVAGDPQSIDAFCKDFSDFMTSHLKIEGPDEIVTVWS